MTGCDYQRFHVGARWFEFRQISQISPLHMLLEIYCRRLARKEEAGVSPRYALALAVFQLLGLCQLPSSDLKISIQHGMNQCWLLAVKHLLPDHFTQNICQPLL